MLVNNAQAALRIEIGKNQHFRGKCWSVHYRKTIHATEVTLKNSTEEPVIGVPLIFVLRKHVSETHLRHLSDTMNYYPEISQSPLEILWAESI